MNEANDSKFVTRKWNNCNDQSYVNFAVGNKTINNLKFLKSNLFKYNDAYILLRSDTETAPPTQVTFKNWAQFIKCIGNTKLLGKIILKHKS